MHLGGMKWLMSDDIMTEEFPGARILCMIDASAYSNALCIRASGTSDLRDGLA